MREGERISNKKNINDRKLSKKKILKVWKERD